MLLAAEAYLRASALREVGCAKLNHRHGVRCIFHYRYRVARQPLPEALPEPPGL